MPGARTRWEHFPHGADVGIRGVGPTVEEAFAEAVLALTAVVTDPARVRPLESRALECEGSSLDDLFFAFIDELVFEMSAEGLLFCRAEVHIEGTRLRARLEGEPIDRVRHEPAVEVKGPTLTELRVAEGSEGGAWVAQCVVDV